ncbi:MAG: ABC transporter permease [Candidatus Omnitrophica bacterium]|nr:ABC transporter permease [Candidatus Omnitrophota bacterium]
MSATTHSPFLAGLYLIVRRSLRRHALSTTVTAASVALASGLVMAVFSIADQTRTAFTGGKIGYDAILGARGSPLQLVLNTVYHLETSPGNIPWKLYQTIREDPRVDLAVPYAVGDNYRGFRIVGTTEDIFGRLEYQPGKRFEFQGKGRPFDAKRREAVIGSFVAQRTGLRLNSTFNPYHGLTFDETMRHPEEYVVVGILKPTNTPSDRVIWIPIEGIFRMEGHVLRGSGEEFQAEVGKEIPDDHKEVSAVMLKFKNPQAGFALDQTINKQGKVATLAFPIGSIMASLFDKMGWVNRVLILVAYLVVLVAAGSILASIYNTMNERRREFAILRALGARRRTVFSAIVLEASTISALGVLAGYLVYAGILAGAALVVRAQTGVVLDVFSGHQVLYLAPIVMIVVGALAGVVPAFKAYSTDVAANLTPHS